MSEPDAVSEARRFVLTFQHEEGNYLVYEWLGRFVAYRLTQERTRIGHSLAADLRFDDPTVSRRHALVVAQANGIRILDDRSTNGVFLNNERVEWQDLHDGDRLRIGVVSMVFVVLGAELESDTSRDADLDEWLAQIGPVWTQTELDERFADGRGSSFAAVLTVPVTAQLLALDDGHGGSLYPAFQFNEFGTPYPDLAEVLPVLRRSGADAYTLAVWFTSPQEHLGQSPAHWLAAHMPVGPLIDSARNLAERLRR